MPKGRVRNMFPGGNTSKGFYSFYKYIITQEDARRIFILKGGPGVGKSTFMKKTGEAMTERGYDVEFMHCSSDNNSLDGVVVPKIGVALIDGTAPHVVDPKNPGVVDEIIHLGDYWNEAAMRKGRDKVIKINKEISNMFESAYRYLRAAACIYEDSAAIYSSGMDRARVNRAARELMEEVFGDIPSATVSGHERSMFASAITPEGLKNYLDDLIARENVYILKGFPGAGTEKVLERLKETALELGFNVEAYYCAFNPEKLEHLIIPGLDTAFATVGKYHSTDACAKRKIDFAEMLNDHVVASHEKELEFNQTEFDRLLNRAINRIREAKKMHDDMESCYIPYMDFDAVRKRMEATIERILEYADES